MGPSKVSMGTKNAMGVVDGDKAIEESDGSDFPSLGSRGGEGITFLGASVLATDAEEALKKGDSFLNPDGTVAGSGNDKRVVTVLPVPDARDSRDGPGDRGHDGVKLEHRQGVPLERSALSVSGGADSSVKKEAG